MSTGSALVTDGAEATAVTNPWQRWEWVVQSVWLVFLIFPLLSVLAEQRPVWQKALGVAGVVAFGACYLIGARRIDQLADECGVADRGRVQRVGSAYFVVLVAIVLVMVPFIAVDVLSFMPFVVAFGMFALPVRWAVVCGVLGVVTVTLVTLTLDNAEGAWVLVIIVFAVGSMTAGIRFMSDRGRLYESTSRELAIVAERERVARDVHDVLGHSLTVVTVKAELAERLVDLDPARAKAELVEIQSLSRQALAEIRATVGGLRVARLDDELKSARIALAGAGIAADLPDEPGVVDPRHRIVFAWVLREAVTNVVRHSDADSCRVELDTGLLRVSDDGRGLGGRREGNGLRGLRERVAAAGGALTIHTGPQGQGTVLEVTM